MYFDPSNTEKYIQPGPSSVYTQEAQLPRIASSPAGSIQEHTSPYNLLEKHFIGTCNCFLVDFFTNDIDLVFIADELYTNPVQW